MRRLAGAALAAGLAVALAVTTVVVGQDHPAVDPQRALAEGNRLFRNGQLEAAVDSYRQGYAPGVDHPTLLYNLGTTMHHLGRLPEAILWYRRAGANDDTWLDENLWLARRALGSQSLPPGDALGRLSRHAGWLCWLAVAVSWGLLAALLTRRRLPPAVLLGSALLALALYAGGAAAQRWGPRQAILLADCGDGDRQLPAGTEAWVRRSAEGWQVSGAGLHCPEAAIAPVDPLS